MKVGPRAILTRTAPGLAGEVGCVRGQALPCMEEATGPSRRIFPKRKETLCGTLGNSPAATVPVSSPPHHPSGGCMHLISEGPETTGTTQGRVPSEWECLHLISEGTETKGKRESANQGRLCTHIHSPEMAYHKKRVGRSGEHQDSSWKRKPTNKRITNR